LQKDCSSVEELIGRLGMNKTKMVLACSKTHDNVFVNKKVCTIDDGDLPVCFGRETTEINSNAKPGNPRLRSRLTVGCQTILDPGIRVTLESRHLTWYATKFYSRSS